MVNKRRGMKETVLSPKEKIIRHLIEHKEPISIRGISRALNMDYKNSHSIINDPNIDIIAKENLGNTYLIELKPTSNQEIYTVEKKRAKQFLSENTKIQTIQRYTEELGYPFMIVLVFGSYAKEEKTKHSDIDICIISDNKEKTKELEKNLHVLSLKIEIHSFTSEEFISMIEKRKHNLGHEIVKKNIILYGIENYYNLISPWMNNE